MPAFFFCLFELAPAFGAKFILQLAFLAAPGAYDHAADARGPAQILLNLIKALSNALNFSLKIAFCEIFLRRL